MATPLESEFCSCFTTACVQALSLSHVQLLATLWTVAHQTPLSRGFSRQEYGSGVPFPSPGDLPDPGIKPGSPALRWTRQVLHSRVGWERCCACLQALKHGFLCLLPGAQPPWGEKSKQPEARLRRGGTQSSAPVLTSHSQPIPHASQVSESSGASTLQPWAGWPR